MYGEDALRRPIAVQAARVLALVPRHSLLLSRLVPSAGHLRGINDPEHPLTLEQLGVVQPDLVGVDSAHHEVRVQFTPTIPHCSMATLIGLCIKVKLARSLPRRYRTSVSITPGSHASEAAINKQLADKERVAAAMENAHLLDVVDRCLDGADPRVDVHPSMAIASEAAEW